MASRSQCIVPLEYFTKGNFLHSQWPQHQSFTPTDKTNPGIYIDEGANLTIKLVALICTQVSKSVIKNKHHIAIMNNCIDCENIH